MLETTFKVSNLLQRGSGVWPVIGPSWSQPSTSATTPFFSTLHTAITLSTWAAWPPLDNLLTGSVCIMFTTQVHPIYTPFLWSHWCLKLKPQLLHESEGGTMNYLLTTAQSCDSKMLKESKCGTAPKLDVAKPSSRSNSVRSGTWTPMAWLWMVSSFMGPPTFEGFFVPLIFHCCTLVFELINYSMYCTTTLFNFNDSN